MSETPARPAHVLLIDDEPDFLEPITYWLSARGYRVSTASSGARALELVRGERPDVVFLDVMMPQMDGIEVLRRIRAIDKELPVILVTTSDLTDEGKYAGASSLGIAGLFPKGSSLIQLGEILEVAVRRIRRPEPAPAAPPAAPPPTHPLQRLWRRLLRR